MYFNYSTEITKKMRLEVSLYHNDGGICIFKWHHKGSLHSLITKYDPKINT